MPSAVAKAAMEPGVARKPIEDMDAYRHALARGSIPTAALAASYRRPGAGRDPKRVVFAEGEERSVIRAATPSSSRDLGYGDPVLVGREEEVLERLAKLGGLDPDELI